MYTSYLETAIEQKQILSAFREIAKKIFANQRISTDECLLLYNQASLGLLSMLANYVRNKKNKNYIYYNKNIHIEPTNICINSCKFCSYSRKLGDVDSWHYTTDEIIKRLKPFRNSAITEVHIVGGVYPNYDVYYYANMLKQIKNILPKVYIKAFTAVELDYMIRQAKMSIEEGLQLLKQNGLTCIPGGGAEIFNPKIRQELCSEKSSSELWLTIHQKAHQCGIPSNATMLYGHIETYVHRVEHLDKIRQLQDQTNGFLAFIPLKYRMKNNVLSHIGETSIIDDMRTYAISRIFLDNIPHIKAYWPMLGKEKTQLSLNFGVDDIDGTINDTTQIYSMAGAEEQRPTMTEDEMKQIITQCGFEPVERDTLYNPIKK